MPEPGRPEVGGAFGTGVRDAGALSQAQVLAWAVSTLEHLSSSSPFLFMRCLCAVCQMASHVDANTWPYFSTLDSYM